MKSEIRKYIIVLFSLLFFSCSQENIEKENIKIKLVDDLGREIELIKTPKRVISLAPSITEILYFIGEQNKLVARTQACDYPNEVEKLPVVSTYPLDFESIVKFKPDLGFIC